MVKMYKLPVIKKAGVDYFPMANIYTSLYYVTDQLENHVDIEGVPNADDKGAVIVGRIRYVF